MKIRTDFVTNSSSSSFTLILNITMKDGREFSWKGTASSGEGNDNYYELYASKSPEELAQATSIDELIKMLDDSLTDGSPEEGEDNCNSLGIGTRWATKLHRYSMDDIESIEITGNEDNYETYYRTYIYHTETAETEELIEGDEFEKNGGSGGDLLFANEYFFPYEKEKVNFPLTVGVEGTAYSGREGRIEHIRENDRIILKNVYDSPYYYGVVVEAFNEKKETLGFLNSFNEPISKLVSENRYQATVEKVIPLSKITDKRRKHPVLEIKIGEIEAETNKKGYMSNNHFDELSKKAFNFETSENGLVAVFKNKFELNGFNERVVLVPSEVNGETIESINIYGIPSFVQKIIIPSTIKSILEIHSTVIFGGYDGNELVQIEIDENNQNYWSDGYSIFSKDKKTLLRFMSYKSEEYVVPEGTETIGKLAFNGMDNLVRLTLPRSIKKIGDGAFYSCEKLSDIQGIEYVSKVGSKLFENPDYSWRQHLSNPYANNKSVIILGTVLFKYNDFSEKIIRIPDGVTVIGANAFDWESTNDNVEEIVLPSSVTTIEESAFRGRKKLKKINIPNGVLEIQDKAFRDCEELVKIEIPPSVEKIEAGAFPIYRSKTKFSSGNACAIKEINVDSENKHYCSINGMLLTKDTMELLYVPHTMYEEKLEIPEGVKVIGKNLAIGNEGLVELVLSDSVTEIRFKAFAECGHLKNITFSERLENIGDYAFEGCKKIKTVKLPKALKSIGDHAFYECGLKTVKLPENIEHIGEEAFAGTSISKAKLPKSTRTVGWGAFSRASEIEIYDSIDPDAGEANKEIDDVNGYPNSTVGYIGIGPTHGNWKCASNHRWRNYTIVVKSTETNKIKYKVWMGADSDQRNYYSFLSSGWGHNATFAFEYLDKFFPNIVGDNNKLRVARYRLEYPYELSETAREIYKTYIMEKIK